ncbi:MAG: VCBS repeat-containing protein [Spirochaetes bacterium]|nr:VCBS repeat-containing protein [Spirochaetota bacterium]
MKRIAFIVISLLTASVLFASLLLNRNLNDTYKRVNPADRKSTNWIYDTPDTNADGVPDFKVIPLSPGIYQIVFSIGPGLIEKAAAHIGGSITAADWRTVQGRSVAFANTTKGGGVLNVSIRLKGGKEITAKPGVYSLHPRSAGGGSSFTEINNGQFTASEGGCAVYGDIDGDGDLDIIMTGWAGTAKITKLYLNNGLGSFTEGNSAQFSQVYPSTGGSKSCAFGDVDNDGDLDLLITGTDNSSGYHANVYRNDGGGVFTEISAGQIAPVTVSSASFGDIDNDGNLDLIVTGGNPFAFTPGGFRSKIYRNTGGGIFTEIHTGTLIDSGGGNNVLGDIDGDNDLDLIITSANATTGYAAAVYTNAGNGSFGLKTSTLTPVSQSAAVLGDIDNDGDLDLVISGDTGAGYKTIVYTNTGTGVFSTLSTTMLTGTYNGALSFGHITSDNNLDVLLTGNSGGPVGVSKIYSNDGSGGFIEILSGSLTNVFYGFSIMFDADNDGDCDVFLGGSPSNTTRTVRMFRNNP